MSLPFLGDRSDNRYPLLSYYGFSEAFMLSKILIFILMVTLSVSDLNTFNTGMASEIFIAPGITHESPKQKTVWYKLKNVFAVSCVVLSMEIAAHSLKLLYDMMLNVLMPLSSVLFFTFLSDLIGTVYSIFDNTSVDEHLQSYAY